MNGMVENCKLLSQKTQAKAGSTSVKKVSNSETKIQTTDDETNEISN